MRQKKLKESQTIVHQVAPTTYAASNARAIEKRRAVSYQKRQELVSIAEQIAGTKLCEKNWYFPNGRQKFHFNAALRYVDKYFPYAKGGPLLVDEPQDSIEIAQCHVKAAYLRSCGFRYVIIEPNMSVDDCLAQLRDKN